MGLTEWRLGVWQRNTEKMGEPNSPKNERAKKKKNLTSTDCVQSQHAWRGTEESQDHLYYFQLGHLHLHIIAELLN